MQTEVIKIDRVRARALYRDYKKHLHYSTPIDRECMRAYQLLAQGRTVIKALESIVAAGLNEKGLPKLAIARADATACTLLGRVSEGSATMTSEKDAWRRNNAAPSKWFDFPAGSFPGLAVDAWQKTIALSPGIPGHLRPRRGLENYHILWEAEWSKVVPRDPFLLRRIGQADLWLVVAAWELTEVERAALATRIAV